MTKERHRAITPRRSGEPVKKLEAQFLNADLDLCLERRLPELLAALKRSVVVLHQTDTSASIELARDYRSLEETVAAYITLVESLSPTARRLWNQCDVRSVNVGVRAGTERSVGHFALSTHSIISLAKIGCSMEFTVYPPDDATNEDA